MRALFDRLRSAEDVAHEQADGVNKDANILGAVFLRRVEDLRNAEDKGRACVTDVSERALCCAGRVCMCTTKFVCICVYIATQKRGTFSLEKWNFPNKLQHACLHYSHLRNHNLRIFLVNG